MAKRPINVIVAYLKQKQIVSHSPSATMLLNARHIHELTYSLILWRFRLKGLPVHSNVFIEEIASDALQILPQIMMGYSKTAKLLIRGIIENVLRHIYFADHPIEFGYMNSDKKWFLPFDELASYAKRHPEYVKTERKVAAIEQLISLYKDLSGGVHGRSVRDLEMRTALKKISIRRPDSHDRAFVSPQDDSSGELPPSNFPC
ncbi:hypothetical protein [Bradyrhizobium arachidis]|uniref:Uncharacterized protein n=1 Tax=Bradyrhizobium arachidis TaxID=858423 RepID=A0AAE7NKG2_9BRAD|nr:hypothetical protein [Bradyrhizobium arachidis]QOZ66617.1 hypothetical protein WN72_09710 [Bradyrhizobium arachidis]SFV17384.1 hypothetical protein SAMN05192541_12849 [Bradyrhizobium arachidis]